MIQIIGKGGMAREIHAYVPESIMFEHDGVNHMDKHIPAIIAIGDPASRKKINDTYPNYTYTPLILGKVHGAGSIGIGTIICPGAHVIIYVKLGKHCIVNVNAAVHHDVEIGDYCTISPSATICGNVKIGNLCYIGANAVIREKIKICNGVMIGCGAVVVKDITEPGTYVGNPATKL